MPETPLLVPKRLILKNPDPAEKKPPISMPESLDRMLHVWQSRYTGGRSPSTVGLALLDWAAHATNSPFQTAALAGTAFTQWSRLARTAMGAEAAIMPKPDDHRFVAPAWQHYPYNLLTQAVLLGEEWWDSVVQSPNGVGRPNARIVAFTVRQWLDLMSPSNVPWLNPEVIEVTRATDGANFATGMSNLLHDQAAANGSAPTGRFIVGKDLAATPGKVVFRNALIELIQYAPTTATVGVEPILIVPAWIMKYYILDLSPHNSLVKFLVEQGFTVFMVSWRNPTASDRNLSLEDYRRLGVDAAIAAINEIVPSQPIHATGYCLGGTLLSIAAARLATERPHCLASLTLFAAQTDFTEAGELTLFINESQVAFLEDMMWRRGVLDTTQMAGAFQMLRSNDLIWSRMIRDYLIGEREPLNDLMSWNADATRMPYRMHSDYLRKLFLDNDLAEGRYRVDGKPIALSDLHAPMFVVGTLRDHVAPWKSTYKINFLADAEVTYVLTGGGHNAGIVAPPGEGARGYQMLTKGVDGPYLGADEWLQRAPHHEGSWWSAWAEFLADRSGEPVTPPVMGGARQRGAALDDAPGTYVLQR